MLSSRSTRSTVGFIREHLLFPFGQDHGFIHGDTIIGIGTDGHGVTRSGVLGIHSGILGAHGAIAGVITTGARVGDLVHGVRVGGLATSM